jgi:signal transduction histidine kinase
MSQRQPARLPAQKRPRFLWRGLLIVLPALVMAGFGFMSLRQDRLLARHQASEEATQLGAELVEIILPAALRLDAARPMSIRPQTDPILAADRDGLIVALVEHTGALLHPPPFRWPMPEPLEADGLDAARWDQWRTAQRAFYGGDQPSVAAERLETLLAGGLPARLEALARFHLLELGLRNGPSHRAMEQLEWLRRLDASIRSESGLPVRLLAEWRWLRSIDPDLVIGSAMQDSLDWVCARLVFDPSPISESMLRDLQEFDSDLWHMRVTAPWIALWDAHQRARRFVEFLGDLNAGSPTRPRSTAIGWIEFERGQRLVLSQPVEGGAWWLAWSEETLSARVRRILEVMSLPQYLGCEVRIGGKTITAPAEADSALATVTGRVDWAGGVELATAFWLADPDLLFARQRKRTWWFGSLIAVSAVSVLCGVVAAWRGFRDQQRLSEMKGNFVSSVSHEMRAPIASVRLMAEELVDRGAHDAVKAGEYHGYILQECRRLSALIENVLDFSRHEQGRKQYRFEPTDLVAVVEETTQVMRSYATDRKVTIERRIEGSPFEIELDAAAIQQVLVNLIDNAIKHSPPNAGVDVTLRFPPAASMPTENRIAAADGRLTVQISVRDSGPGIPTAEQRLVFQRFYRRGTELRRETQGIGLGLAIVQYIAEAHGGIARVESQVGQGSRFIVDLPVRRGNG